MYTNYVLCTMHSTYKLCTPLTCCIPITRYVHPLHTTCTLTCHLHPLQDSGWLRLPTTIKLLAFNKLPYALHEAITCYMLCVPQDSDWLRLCYELYATILHYFFVFIFSPSLLKVVHAARIYQLADS